VLPLGPLYLPIPALAGMGPTLKSGPAKHRKATGRHKNSKIHRGPGASSGEDGGQEEVTMAKGHGHIYLQDLGH
jgi:hypothetical protein